MPLYRYQAKDKNGGPVDGSTMANDVAGALTNLQSRGLEVVMLDGMNVGPNSTQFSQVRPPVNQNLPPVSVTMSSTGIQGGVGYASNHNSNVAPASKVTSTTNSTGDYGKQNNKCLMFIFSQLHSYLNSGVNIATALENLGNNQPNEFYKHTLLEGAKATAQGIRFGDFLEKYPRLYPEYIIGMVKAGEAGGFLPLACQEVSTQLESVIEMARWTFWFNIIFWSNTIGMWPILVLAGVYPIMAKLTDQSGGQGSGFSALGQAFWTNAKTPLNFFILILCFVLVGVYKWWLSYANRFRRDALTLKTPALGQRSISEGLHHFANIMGLVSRAGIAPRDCFLYAAHSIPNRKLSADLVEIGLRMRENTPLSKALAESKIIPYEMATMVQTGELTGTIPNQLEVISNIEKGNFVHNSKQAKVKLGCWITLILLLAGLPPIIAYVHSLGSLITYETNPDN